jgi:hypothetical protein
VAEIVSDAQIVHSSHKYMRKFRAREEIEEIQRRIFILSFVYYLFCKHFLFKRSNRWLEFFGEWTSIFEEEYEIPDCLMDFIL